MDNSLDRLEEFIERAENRGNPDWAIAEALSKKGVHKDRVQKAIHNRIRRRRKFKNYVFLVEMVIWFIIVMITAMSGNESILLVAFAFSPILLNFLISFAIIKNLYEKFIIFIVPFLSFLIFYIIYIFIKDPVIRNMDLGTVAMVNILISFFFNIFIYLTGDYKNVNILETPKDAATVERRVNYIIEDNSEDIERLKHELNTSIAMQKDIRHDIETLRHDLMHKEAKPENKEEVVIVTTTGNKFHKAGCIVINHLAPSNLVYYNNKKEAEAKGYRPCRVCLSHK